MGTNYAAWIKDLREELAVCDKEIAARDRFVQKKQVIEATLANLQILAQTNGGGQSGFPMSGIVIRLSPNKSPIWMGVQEILKEVQRPAAVPEIVAELKSRGWELTVNAREVVRTQILRKEDVFVRVDAGLYGLREWPDEIKQRRAIARRINGWPK